MSDARDHRGIALIVASALFMQNLDSAVLATALPAMARDLDEDPARLAVAITSYLVALTVFIPVSGWVADRFGAKRVFMLAIVVFVCASVLCGRSQGVGRAGRLPHPAGRRRGDDGAGRPAAAAARRGKEEHALGHGLADHARPARAGDGPPVGGVLTDLFSWRAVFWINMPVGVIGFVLVWPARSRMSSRTEPGPPDLRGLALSGVGAGAGDGGLETVGRGTWCRLVSAAALVLGLSLRRARRCGHCGGVDAAGGGSLADAHAELPRPGAGGQHVPHRRRRACPS